MFSQSLFFITQSTTPIIGDIAKFFGFLMDNIYNFFGNTFGFYSLGLSIIIFTIITRLLMLPLAFKQQKSMKEMQVIQPDLKKIQDKYKNKKDQESQKKQQAEMSALYQEHGVSPFGGCLPLVIQMPIIFSLFAVLRNIPAYIGNIGEYYTTIAEKVMSYSGYEDKLATLMDGNTALTVSKFDSTIIEKVIDLLYKFQTDTWTQFYGLFPDIQVPVANVVQELEKIYMMFGINLANKPDMLSIGVLIPILNVAIQFLVTKSSMAKNTGSAGSNQTNKTMMYTMPFVSGFFAMQMPAGLGLYWLVGSMFQLGQQLVINKHIHADMDKKKKK